MSKNDAIKLINMDEDAPKEFYIFVDFAPNIYDNINRNNFSLSNRMVSAGFLHILLSKQNLINYEEGEVNHLPFVGVDMTNVCPPSTFILKTINNYNLEHNLEWFRRNYFKKYPSRFSSLFAFGDYESCKKVAQIHGWNLSSVKKFRISEDLGEYMKYVRIGKFNMEIVSLLRGVPALSFSREDQDVLYKKYWEGEETAIVKFGEEEIVSGTIYEYLIEGVLEEIG